MATVITNQFDIDAAQALRTLTSIQQSFVQHNAQVGNMTAQYATFNREGKNATATFTQINDAGNKVVTTLKDMGTGYEAVNVKVSAASAAQRRLASDLERQRTLADNLARSFARLPGNFGGLTNRTPTTTPGLTPAQISGSITAFGRITVEQAKAAAEANNFSVAQRSAFVNVVTQANQARDALDRVRASTAGFRSALSQLGQIAFATAIYRSLSLIQLGLTQGTRSAAEYSRQIGLIQTLAEGGTDTYKSWDLAIRKVADQFGRPSTEIAEASYEALSNQVIKTSKDMGLLSVAAELARNTNSKTTQSLDVLSSVLNTYGSTAGTAQQISDELFVTVDIGRVKVSELANVIGRSSGIARTAGVSFRELAAGLAVQTRAGIDSAESATLLNNVFSQLIKPNEALTAQFQKMGFVSGPAAVSTLGFAGTMKALAEAAKETDEGIATFFPEIRGLRGAATFAGDGINQFIDVLNKLEAAQGRNSRATTVLNNNLGQSLIDETQRIKNFFTVDIGQQALEAVANLTRRFGGLDEIVTSFGVHAKVAAIGLAGVFALGAAAKLLTITYDVAVGLSRVVFLLRGIDVTAKAVGATLATEAVSMVVGLGLVSVAAFAVIEVIRGIDKQSREAARTLEESFKSSMASAEESVTTAANEQTRSFHNMIDNMTREYGAFVAQSKRNNKELQESANDNAKTIAGGLKNNFEVLLNVARQGLSKLEAEQKKAADNQLKIDKDRVALSGDLDKRAYDRKLKTLEELRSQYEAQGITGLSKNQDPTEQILKLTNARNDALRKIEATSVAKGDLDEAKSVLNEIQSNLEKIGQIREQQRNSRGQTVRGRGRGQQVYEGIGEAQRSELQNYLRLTDQLKQKDQERTVALANQIELEKQQIKDLEDLLAKTSQFATKGVFNKEGKISDEFKDDPSKALEELDRLQKAAIEAAGTLKGVADPLTLVQYNAALKEIQESFGKQRANVELQLQLAQTATAQDKAARESVEQAENAKKAVADLTNVYKEQQLQIEQNIARVKALGESINTQVQSGRGSGSVLNRLTTGYWDVGFTGQDRAQVGNLANGLSDTLSKSGPKNIKLAQVQLNQLTKLVQDRAPNLQFVDATQERNLTNYVDGLKQMQTLLSEIAQQQEESGKTSDQLQEQSDKIVQMSFQIHELAKASGAIDITRTKTQEFVGATSGLDEATARYNKVADAIKNMGKALDAVPKVYTPSPAGGAVGEPPGFASGGRVQGNFWTNFFTGAYAKGTDVIPAMLSKREFVVRAPMADRYYSQLVAMNAGTAPVYRSQGGPVTNSTNVGDININLNGEGRSNSLGLAREVAQHISRGIKNGTIRL